MIRLCGIPDCTGKSPDETNGCAAAALRAYKARDPHSPNGGNAVGEFRQNNPMTKSATFPVPIQFIGAWDTVEALGLPFEEMKRGLNHLFKLRMHEGERELYENVLHARHALSVDDERLTFRPMVWDETKVDRTTQTVKQVWFPGVHSNVGGGYAKDQLALISLNWMMAEAGACGLKFYMTLWGEYGRDADVDGQIYDSRSGLGFYYRYHPRSLRELCEGKTNGVTLHASVLQRVSLGTDDYAPDGVPAAYGVESWSDVPAGMPKDYVLQPPAPAPRESKAEERAGQLEVVQDVIWWRKVGYVLFLLWTVTAVVLCWRYRTADPVVDLGAWSFRQRLAYHLLDPVLGLIQWATPSYFESGVIAARHHPLAAICYAMVLPLILWVNGRLKRKYRELTVKAWRTSLLPAAGKPPKPDPWLTRSKKAWWDFWLGLARAVRRSWFARAAQKVWLAVAPTLTLLALAAAVVWIGARYLAPAVSLSANDPVELDPQANRRLARGESPVATVGFDTKNSLQPTPFVLVQGEKYRIGVTPTSEPWLDWSAPAGPDGVKDPSGVVFQWAGQLKRDRDQNWFKVMGSVGPDLDDAFAIGSETYYRAPRTGRLYLFVNDMLLTYGNNHGKATVEVECVTPDMPVPPPRPATTAAARP